MKAASFTSWEINDTTMPLLFLIQSMEEMLFPYGHDSYKVPALNFHFICVEILSCIEKIEYEVVDKGNMKPLFEELEAMFGMDDIAKKLYGHDFSSLFYAKNDKGEYNRDISQLRKNPSDEISIKRIQRTISFLLDDMNINDKYFNTLKNEISDVLHCGQISVSEQKRILSLSRLFLTEVINRGYSQEYVYSCIRERYYSDKNTISNIDEELDYIWNLFSFENKKYRVILPVKRAETKKYLTHFQNVEIRENDMKYFGNSCRWIVVVDVEAYEPQKAREEATALIELFAGLKQYSRHKSRVFYANQAIVQDLETGKDFILKKPVQLMSRRREKNEQLVFAQIGELILTFPVIGEKMINVINLHTSALESTNVSNQLLNLWTIVEVLVEVDKRYSYNKITQISNTLTTVLNSSYIKSLVEQLSLDLSHCVNEFADILDAIDTTGDEIIKLTALLVLPQYQENKELLLGKLNEYPLLVYRIKHYSDIFSNRRNLKEYLNTHRKRLEWQIIRIYRNRNMIVHDGTHFPYIDVIVQNLHYYIDTLIDCIIYYVDKGYGSLESIYTYMGHNEYQNCLLFEKKDDDNKDLAIMDDFIHVVLGE